MSSYYKKDSFGRAFLFALLIALAVECISFAIEVFSFKNAKHELSATTEIESVVYNETENKSKFTLLATFEHKDHSHTVVTDVAYKISFKDASGNVLCEQTVNYDGVITEEKNEVELSFNSEESAVAGRVTSADVEVISQNYVNKIVHEGGPVGIQYLTENWLLILVLILPIIIMILAELIAHYTDGFMVYVIIFFGFGVAGFIFRLVLSDVVAALLA